MICARAMRAGLALSVPGESPKRTNAAERERGGPEACADFVGASAGPGPTGLSARKALTSCALPSVPVRTRKDPRNLDTAVRVRDFSNPSTSLLFICCLDHNSPGAPLHL
jgi:hypothetical protein